MKTAKKVIKTILALLPLMGLVMLMLTSFNAKSETYPTHSQVRISPTTNNVYIYFTNPQSTNSKIIGALYSTSYNTTNENQPDEADGVNGALKTLAKLANKLTQITGIPETYTLITIWYAFYLFMIEMAFMILNIITFIPRKCGEFFGG